MSACLLALYWPDFARESDCLPYSPDLFAHALRRHLSLRHAEHSSYLLGSRADHLAGHAPVFRRWGMQPLEGAVTPDLLVELAEAHPSHGHVTFVMHPERAAEAARTLREAGRRVSVWRPAPIAGADPDRELLDASLQEEVPVLAARDVLNLATAHPVGLFVEARHLQEGLRREGIAYEAEGVLERVLRAGELAGSVVMARLYGAGGRALELSGAAPPPLPAEDGPGTGDEALRADLLHLLNDGAGPRTWILISDAPCVPELIERAQRRGIRVLLWPADGRHVSPSLRAAADGFACLPPLLDLEESPCEPAASPQVIQASIRTTVSPVREPEPVREASSPQNPVVPGARLGPWLRLMYQVECSLRRNGWTKSAFRKMAGMLAELDEFGPTPTNALMWLNRAKAEGMLLVEQEPHRTDPSLRVTICRPNPEHPITRAAQDVPDRCLRLLRQMLQKMPWVSFKLLRSVLLREQWLGGPPYSLDETSVDEWLNFLVQEGAVTMTKEPNLDNPEFPVTALRLNEGHPLSRSVLAEAAEGRRLAAERAILAIDHFLTRNRKPWMAMSALRRNLETMGREELQGVLQGLQNLGALITESYPNPQKEHSTTGCRLKSDEPIVLETLRTRNAIIRVTQYHQRYRNWVPLVRLEEELAAQEDCRVPAGDRSAWFLLLRDEDILEIDQETLPASGWGAARCRLNVTDAVVRAVVAESPTEAA